MKNTLLFFLFIFSAQFSSAQNYQCLQSGAKHYFINRDNYVRGIRIDSVRTSGSNMIYYPYHTDRISYVPLASTTVSVTKQGSWLGEKVIQKPDGTFLFDNLWDTVIIKPQAHLGTTWMMYNDTGIFSYNATVTSIDTMTVLGVLDSIKRITIKALRNGLNDTLDPVNNFQIILSKNNGFVQAIDLYTFPYHKPDSISFTPPRSYGTSGFDYYLDNLLGNLGNCDLCLPNIIPDTINSVFHLFPFRYPAKIELYNFAAGDVYESGHSMAPMIGAYYFNNIILDSVINVVRTPYSVTYTVDESSIHQTPITNTSGSIIGQNDIYSGGVTTWTYDTTSLLDPNTMPEETDYLLHYFPHADGFCDSPAEYVVDEPIGLEYGYNGTNPVSSYNTKTYAIGYGYTRFASLTAISFVSEDYGYSYIYKNGSSCHGTYIPVVNAVKNIASPAVEIQIFPNPANNELTIKTTNTPPYTISIYNMIGQKVYILHTTQLQQTINTSELPAGLYNVIITDNGGNRQNTKVSIVH